MAEVRAPRQGPTSRLAGPSALPRGGPALDTLYVTLCMVIVRASRDGSADRPARPRFENRVTMTTGTSLSDTAWDSLLGMFRDLGEVIREDAANDRERLEGYRVLARVIALCSELTIDVDPDVPRFFPMTTALRQVGGPNPDGEYDLATLTPGRSYRIRGRRGTAAYLGFQVMGGTGLAPRRQVGHVSDRDLRLDPDGNFEFVLAVSDPQTGEHWIPIPPDASAVVVRQYVSDRSVEEVATYTLTQIEPAGPVPEADDVSVADQLTAMTWTVFKLMTLHRTVLPELLLTPNRLITAEAATLGSENTTPDNLYMLGSFDLADDQALVLDVTPPETRYWSVTLENLWHECLEPHRRSSSATRAGLLPRADGTVRIVISGADPGVPNWLDTGRRARGFVILRWLDNPQAPRVDTHVLPLTEVHA